MSTQMTFAENLQHLRSAANLSPEQMARLLSVSPSEWSSWESGSAHPDPASLVRISDTLHIPLDRLLRHDLRQIAELRAKRDQIKLFLLDIDGTLTNGGMMYSESGDQIKQFNVKDGMAIYRLIKRGGKEFGFISSGNTIEIMKTRAKTLGIQRVYAGKRPKVEVIDEWLAEMGATYEELAYVGDDLNDLPAIQKAGMSACPADACWQVRAAVDLVLTKGGGQGCVREFLEEVLGYDIHELRQK
ncbi:helix-turn-helix domain-containing protein [Pontibacter sp. G13]|uniref:helix-turn-helix domain-containing protein n=1 Tax=Pontibacter sp. G13 TaxID=3074898 RepID=UPI00288AB446|nr:helix-turn-helix domain-containing protein [Pontibacter sp. G13]WNJ19856.1 helix-turn-helix domain-containing protein [Pontibacter sp. G13]